MLLETLVVTAVNAEQMQLQKPSSDACQGCAHRLLGASPTRVFKLPRPEGLDIKIGDQVSLRLPKQHFYQLIAWAYALPLSAFIAGAFLVVRLPLALNTDFLAFIGAGLGLVLSQFIPLPRHLTHAGMAEAGILAINSVQSRSA